jgi:hypothetical protein
MLALRIAGCLAMKEGGQMAPPRTPALLPLALLFVPKCPLCVLPLFAAFGSVLPPAPVLDAFVVAIALAWLALLARARPPWLALEAGIGGALVLFAGRRLDLPLASWSGALLMAGVALSVRARKIRRQRLERAASGDVCGPEGCR